MALTFPRPMPTGGVDGQAFEILRVDYLSPTTDGRLGAATAGFPLWRTALTLGNGDADEVEEWIAWVDAQRGAQRLFLGRDLTRPYPKAYPKGFAGMTRVGGGAFTGAVSGWSINADRDQLTLPTLPEGLDLSWRDSVSFRWATGGEQRRALVRLVEPAIAVGGVVTVAVEPPLPGLVPGTAVAHLDLPDCLMRLVPNETRIGELDTVHSAGGTVVGLQELLP